MSKKAFIEHAPNSFQYAGRSRVAMISVNKAGLFHISKSASDLMGLVPGDRVKLLQDPDEKINFFIKPIGKAGDGFQLRPLKVDGTDGSLCFSSSGLRRSILENIFGKIPDKTATFLIGERASDGSSKNSSIWPLLSKPII